MGYRPLFMGWQGVIPSKAQKMAIVVVEKGLQSLTNVSEVYSQIDREILAKELVNVIDGRLEGYIDDLMNAENATIWENLPANVRESIYRAFARNFQN